MAKKKTVRPALEYTAPVIGETIMINGISQERARINVLFGDKADAVWKKGLAEKAAMKHRNQIRADIKNKVADPESLLGTTADGAQLAVAALLVDVVSLADAKSFAEYKAARLALMSELVGIDHQTGKPVNVTDLAKGLLAQIKSGDVRLTAVIKGVPAVLAEVMERSSKVVAILSGASK